MRKTRGPLQLRFIVPYRFVPTLRRSAPLLDRRVLEVVPSVLRRPSRPYLPDPYPTRRKQLLNTSASSAYLGPFVSADSPRRPDAARPRVPASSRHSPLHRLMRINRRYFASCEAPPRFSRNHRFLFPGNGRDLGVFPRRDTGVTGLAGKHRRGCYGNFAGFPGRRRRGGRKNARNARRFTTG